MSYVPDESGENGKRFRSLMETYTMYMFFLTLALMYPNPRTERKRKRFIAAFILSTVPSLVIVSADMRLRILRGDMANLVRQSIIMVSLVFTIIKLILTIIRKKELREIIDEINEDYETFNDLPAECQAIVADTIKTTKTLEKTWIVILAVTASSYPVLACACTIYSQMLSDDPKRFMVHETAMIFLTEEQKYQTPYFEAISIYSLYIVWVVFLGFSGYDGMFSVCILHVSLRIKLFRHNLQHVLDDLDDIPKIKANIAHFVGQHCAVMRLISKIQKCFEVWLVGIFFNAVVQIGMALIQITSNAEADINAMYYFYAVATTVHIYVPCYLASDVTHHAVEVATVAYSIPWESVQDTGIKRSVAIIIARAQTPINFEALGMLTFNMELFVSILQTSYSMYTLLRS
ncbi:odorant receptor 45b-like isoform X1 [Maniola jurtina]|uniref:odorant receptor 45b-like isoform X1 n=1 Tax=Maniola jurtina TaxID=191418 RepID=UPI001E68B6C1|nr:odorant receptor 45b-like isoform X1 [Maniola jurtina]